MSVNIFIFFFFFQAEDGIRDVAVTGVQTCALPIYTGVKFPLTANSTPVLDILPTLASCDASQPFEGIWRTKYRASLVSRWYHVASRVRRLLSRAASNPNSASRVRSGPTSGLPTLLGRIQGTPADAQ